VSRTLVLKRTGVRRLKRLAIRHVKGYRIIAILEIVLPSNKSGKDALDECLKKAEQAINAGIHLLLLDLLPPGRHDPQGLHALISRDLSAEEYELPSPKARTFVSCDAGSNPVAYLEHPSIRDALPTLPLFLASDYSINLPLEETYQATYRAMPEIWREALEGK